MLAPIPYFDLSGYKRRSKVAPTDIDMCESLYPGYLAHRIARGSSFINGRLKKRYLVPLGQEAPLLTASGTQPPTVALQGRPTLGSLEIVIQITTGGPLGTAVFQWSKDGGETGLGSDAAGNPYPFVTTAATVLLGATGLTATFPVGTYAADNLYESSTPVPEIALGWLASLVDVDLWQRRGVNPQDPSIAMGVEERAETLAELKEAADSKDGLFDLPTNDAVGDSAVTQGGPLFYSETSPYAWQDAQRAVGSAEDCARSGTTQGTDTP